MNMAEELKGHDEQENLVVAKLAVAFTYLNEVPGDSWGHQGTPAEMAVMVVKDSKARGHFGFLKQAMR